MDHEGPRGPARERALRAEAIWEDSLEESDRRQAGEEWTKAQKIEVGKLGYIGRERTSVLRGTWLET